MRRLVLGLFLSACGPPSTPPSDTPPLARPAVILGPLTREQVLAAPEWRAAFDEAEPDPAAARALGNVPKGAHIDVYLGTWCSDSHYEVSRFFKALDAIGAPPPFSVTLFGVDRDKRAPAAIQLQRVPTFVVWRGDVEIGRIVEHAPDGIETELTKILSKPR